MPVDQLTTVTAVETAVLAVLAGTPPALAAAHAGIPTTELIDATERYQKAGRAALIRPGGPEWYQISVKFPDPNTAERTVALHLGARLRRAESSGTLTSWWYIRKTPYWHLRLHAEQPHREALRQLVTDIIDGLVARGLVTARTVGVYEPETWAFGGHDAMDVAHQFFHADSATILTYIAGMATRAQPAALGRRELSLLLCTAMLRGAGQDWHEQGDIWHRVSLMRPLTVEIETDRLGGMAGKVRCLLALDVRRATMQVDSGNPLVQVRPWFDAADRTGRALGELARNGSLRRGLRDVLAHHVIFHWNRLGLSATSQAALAHSAVTATLNIPSGNRVPRQRLVSDVAGA
jgi:thiopeptide-type bacteriocin biosynthesis protein